jgi:hypothetical protein
MLATNISFSVKLYTLFERTAKQSRAKNAMKAHRFQRRTGLNFFSVQNDRFHGPELTRSQPERKERKQFRKDLFSRMAQGWHGKCWVKQTACQQEKNFFA